LPPRRKQASRVREDQPSYKSWKHPGGKLRELGPASLSPAELLAVIIGTGNKGRSAESIANDILQKFGSLEALSNVPLSKLLAIKGLGDVKIIRIAAALELARRTTDEILSRHGKEK
jgi:DNA repair protein RadC